MLSSDLILSKNEEIVLLGEKAVLEYEDTIEAHYLQFISSLSNTIRAFFNRIERLPLIKDDKGVLNPVMMLNQRLTVKERKVFNTILRSMEEEATRNGYSEEFILALTYLRSKQFITREEELQLQLYMEIERMTAREIEYLYEFLEDLYITAFYHANYGLIMHEISRLPVLIIDVPAMHNAIIAKIEGSNFMDSYRFHGAKLSSNLFDAIPKMLMRSVDVDAIVRYVESRANVKKSEAVRLVRTEANNSVNQAILSMYNQMGFEYYIYSAVIDSVTSVMCKGLNNQRFRVEDAEVRVNYPPMHPYCRSTTRPDTSMWTSEDFARKSADYAFIEVADGITLEDFFNEHVPQFYASKRLF